MNHVSHLPTPLQQDSWSTLSIPSTQKRKQREDPHCVTRNFPLGLLALDIPVGNSQVPNETNNQQDQYQANWTIT